MIRLRQWLAAARSLAAAAPGRRAARFPWLLALLACLGPGVRAAQDEFVPKGALGVEIAVFREEQVLAFTRFAKLRHLKHYLLPDREVREATDGEITRTLTDVNLSMTFGLRDDWNLFVQLPYRELEQNSTLTTDSTDAETQAEVETLRSQTLSGPGDLRVLSMHRPVFSDRNGFIWGYGLTHPVLDRSDTRPGVQALALRSSNPTARAFFHYTRYPRIERARFDIRGEAQVGIPGTIEFAEGRTGVSRTGNGATVEVGWYQELGPFGAGISIQEFVQAQSRIGGVGQSDPQKETVLHYRLGYGNLTELERGPLPQPFQLMLEFDRSLRGFNVPYSNGYTLSLLLFF